MSSILFFLGVLSNSYVFYLIGVRCVLFVPLYVGCVATCLYWAILYLLRLVLSVVVALFFRFVVAAFLSSLFFSCACFCTNFVLPVVLFLSLFFCVSHNVLIRYVAMLKSQSIKLATLVERFKVTNSSYIKEWDGLSCLGIPVVFV